MNLTLSKKKSLIELIKEWIRGNAKIIKNNEFTHYKGLGNELDSYQIGDFLIGVAIDGFYKDKQEALCTYKIIRVKGDQIQVQLLSYYAK